MKIFLDTADIEAVKKWHTFGLVDGITTNPTHLSKTGGTAKNILELIYALCTLLPDKPISVEVTEKEPTKLYKQALEISALAKNIVVKIPCHQDYLEVIKKLVSQNIKVNITLLFSLTQALCMCKLNVAYISPFIGRLSDIDSSGLDLIQDIRHLIDTYNFTTQLLAASVRTIPELHEAALIGADIATVPVSLLEKAMQHPLTEQGIKIFDTDWQKLGIKKFP